MKLYTVALQDLMMCMKEVNLSLKCFKKKKLDLQDRGNPL